MPKLLNLAKELEQEIITEYQNKKTITSISIKYKICQLSVRRILKKHGVYRYKKQYKVDREKILQMHLCGKSVTCISKDLNVPYSIVRNFFKEKNIPLNRINVKYSINQNYFESIDSIEKAYWLGFLYADGCMEDTKHGKCVRLGLQAKDESHIKEFKTALESEHPIKYFTNNFNKKTFKMACVAICNKKLFTDLYRHGCVPCKSLLLEYPNRLQQNFNSHFIRGYFDGDGCISVSHNHQGSFCIIGTKKFLETVQQILIDNCSINKTKICKQSPNSKIWFLSYGGRHNCIKIANFLYKDATVFLKRKKEKFEMLDL